MRRLFPLALFGAIFLCATFSVSPTRAETPASEIAFLIDQVETSSVTFIRNGKSYDGKAAAAHLRQKQKHFQSKIRTAEDFIRLAATKSELTGRPYLVQNAGQAPIHSDEWFARALEEHRAAAPTFP